MEIKIQFLEIIPSINDLKTNSNDVFSMLILYDSFKIIISNFEKNLFKKEISTISVQNNFQKTIPIKLSLFKNSNIIGMSEFNPANETKWINISNTANNQNENKLFSNLKINIKVSIIKSSKINNPKKISNNLTKKEKIVSSASQNLIQRKLYPKKPLNNIIVSPLKTNKNLRNKSLSNEEEINLTDITPQLTNNNTNLYKEKNFQKSQSPISSLHYNKIPTKTNRNHYTNLRMKTPPFHGSKEDKSSSLLKNNKNNSQKIIRIEDTEKYRNYFDINNKEKHKLEEEIIDNDFRKTIKNDDMIINDNNINNSPILNSSSYSFNPSEEDTMSFESNSDFNYELIDPCLKKYNSAKTDFLIFYTDDYLSTISNDTLSLEAQLMIEKIFELQNIFHEQLNILNKKIFKYRNACEHYSELYYFTLKKYNKLREKSKKRDIDKIKYDNKNLKVKKEKFPGMFKQEIKIWNRMIDDNKKSNLKKSLKKKVFKLFIPILISNKNKLSILQKKFLSDLIEKRQMNNTVTFSDNDHHMKNAFSGDLFNSPKIKSVVNIDSPHSPSVSSNRNKMKKSYDDRMIKSYKPKKLSKMLKK